MTKCDNVKKKAVIEAMHKSLGVVTAACKAVDISRETYYRWAKEDKEFKEACLDVKEIALDFAESKLFQKIKDGESSAIFFFLKCQGKKRGYIEGQLNLNAELDNEDKQVMEIGGKAIVF